MDKTDSDLIHFEPNFLKRVFLTFYSLLRGNVKSCVLKVVKC